MSGDFIHLNIHSEYSIVDGIVRIKKLMSETQNNHMSAVALTDHMNLFGVVKFYQAAIAQGIKPILGADIVYSLEGSEKNCYATLLCQTQQGYQHLLQLISMAYTEGQQSGEPRILSTWLAAKNAGLLLLLGQDSDVGQLSVQQDILKAKTQLQYWQTIFGDRTYLALTRVQHPNEAIFIEAAVNLAAELQIPVVAHNAVRFLQEEDFEAHEARVCIHRGNVLADPQRARDYTAQQYFRSKAFMQQLFADIPSALQNSVEIAKRCSVSLALDRVCLPDFPVPIGETNESFIIKQAQQGLCDRMQQLEIAADKQGVYHDRLQSELNVITAMGFAGYFLIVADFIRWAKLQGIPVGPGRGSGGGSLVAYALLITDLDPLQHELLFERFLNPERVSLPDFDIDFCMERRDEVIAYVAEKYGRECVSQIITFGTMAAKAVIRDVGRVLGFPYGFVDKIAKLIPFELGMTLEKALADEPLLSERYDQEEEVQTLLNLALKLEGIVRNAGKHAGGVVIAPSAISDFAPIYCESGSHQWVAQFDKDDIEKIGLVKFDFLGLRTLTLIDWTLKFINTKLAKSNQPPIAIESIPMDDPQTFDLLKACQTLAVFQLESRGMRDLVKRLQPDCFEEIIALVALFRPGPLQSGMVDDFIDRKHGRSPISYSHPDLELVLKPTYGVILYQEQVMQIAQVLANFTLGSADLLRRAMGKKKASEMAKQREIFVDGATARGISKQKATHIFDLMEKFAGYGFNKSHSAAYALLSYQTAWLKAHYPAEFMAAVLSSELQHTEKVVPMIEECRALKLTVLPPDIRFSQYLFSVNEQGEIVYGLGAIKGVGEGAIELLLREQQKKPFHDFFDLCARVDSRKINRRTLEALIRSGAFDALGPDRASLFASIDKALKNAEQQNANLKSGMLDLFAEDLQDITQSFVPAQWSLTELLQGEKDTLGFYFSGHPLDLYEKEFSTLVTGKISDVENTQDNHLMLIAILIAIRVLNTKRGDRMAILTIGDKTGRIELALYPEDYQKYRAMLEVNAVILVSGEVSVDKFTGQNRLRGRECWSLEQVRLKMGRCMRLHCQSEHALEILPLLEQRLALAQQDGGLPVWLNYQTQGVSAELHFDPSWRVLPTEALLQNLRELLGIDAVAIEY